MAKSNSVYTNLGGGLHIRTYVHKGEERGKAWIWRPYYNRKARELPLGPTNMFQEATARALVKGFATKRQAGRSFESIVGEYADFLCTYAEGKAADAVHFAKDIEDPRDAAKFLAGASELAQMTRDLAEAIRERV